MATLILEEISRPADRQRVEAEARVEAYLAAHGLPPERRELIVPEIVQTAEENWHDASDRALPGLAIDEAARRIEGWIAELVETAEGATAKRRAAHGRGIVFLAGVIREWPDLLLSDDKLTPEFVERLRSTNLAASPDMTCCNMIPRPIDLGVVSTMANSTWETFDKWPVLRGLVMWALFLLLLATAFFVVRY